MSLPVRLMKATLAIMTIYTFPFVDIGLPLHRYKGIGFALIMRCCKSGYPNRSWPVVFSFSHMSLRLLRMTITNGVVHRAVLGPKYNTRSGGSGRKLHDMRNDVIGA